MTDPGIQNDDTETEEEKAPPELGDPGKKALDSMKARLKEARGREAEAKAEIERLMKSAVDPDAIEQRVRAQVGAELATERALDRIETKAGKLFEDPDVARALLANRVGEFLKDGKVDEPTIMKALEKLLEDKPYLAARAGRRFAGSADSGARPATGAPEDMNAIIRRAAGIS